MSTEFIQTFVSELISKYGDSSIHELQNYINKIDNSSQDIVTEQTTLYPFFAKISSAFKEQNPIDYEKLEQFCKNVKIINTCKEYKTYYFPNINKPIIIGKNYNSWAKHGDLLKQTEFYWKYESDIDEDKFIYKFIFIKDDDTLDNYWEGDIDSLGVIIENSYGKFTYEEATSDYSEQVDDEFKKILIAILIFYPIKDDIEDWNIFTNILCNEITDISDWINI